jgi:transcriptional regulator with XRE-family HTH domain
MSFSEMLKVKIGEASLAEVATAMGVALPGLRKAISGKSLPNARSLGKYAAFLGISEAEAKELVASAKSTAPVKARTPKAKGGKRSRKAAAAAPAEGEAGEPVATKGKRGRKAGKSGKAGKVTKAAKAGKTSDLAFSLDLIGQAIAKAEAILADPLVNQLYNLSGPKRKAAEAILASVL